MLKPEEEIPSKDGLWSLIFVIFQIPIVLIVLFALSVGNPKRLTSPYDPDHRACGTDLGLGSSPFIYFVSPFEKYLYRTVCVSTCPTLLQQKESNLQTTFYNKEIFSCVPNHIVDSCVESLTSDYNSQILIYQTVQYLNVCIPKNIAYFKAVQTTFQQQPISYIFRNISNGSILIFLAIFIAFFLCTIALRFIPSHSKIVFYVFICTLLLSGSILTSLAFNLTNDYSNLENHRNDLQEQNPDTILNDNQVIAMTHLKMESVSSLINSGVTFIIFQLFSISFIYYYYRTNFSIIKLMSQTGTILQFIGRDLLLLAFFGTLFLVVFLIIWFVIVIHLCSFGKSDFSENQLPFQQFEMNSISIYLGVFLILDFFFVTNYIVGSIQFIYCATFCEYLSFYTQNQTDVNIENSKIFQTALHRYFKNYQGSVIIGRFFILIANILQFFLIPFQMFKSIMELCYQKICGCQSCISEGKQCCFKNCEKFDYFVMSLSSNAFIIGYDKNYSFYESHQYLYKQYIEKQRLYKNDQMGSLFRFLGQLSISGTVAAIVYFLMYIKPAYQQQLSSPFIITFTSFFFAYQISEIYLGIHTEALNTMMTLITNQQINCKNSPVQLIFYQHIIQFKFLKQNCEHLNRIDYKVQPATIDSKLSGIQQSQ